MANSLKNWALDVLRYYGSNPNATVSALFSFGWSCDFFARQKSTLLVVVGEF